MANLAYDPSSFRKYFKNIGRAYREQATTLIEICCLYAEASPQTYTEDDHLQRIFRLADAALLAAGRAKKGRTDEATEAFLRVRDELLLFRSPLPRMDPGDHLPDASTALASASKKDKKATLSKVTLAFLTLFLTPDSSSKGPVKKVNFVFLKSPHERFRDQGILHRELDASGSTTTAEIIWQFSRFPENSIIGIASRQNPHFYLGLPEDASRYGMKFHRNPLKDFGYVRWTDSRTIFVLVDKSCRLFLDAAEPHIPRIFSNLWKPHQTVILKDVFGVLESEDIVFSKIGKRQDYWYRSSITDSPQRRVQPGSNYSDGDNEIIKTPVGNWRALVDLALRSQNVDLMVRDQSKPEPPADSGWMPFPYPELHGEDQTTPTQSIAQLPQLEDSGPNSNFYSMGDSTLFAASTESFETIRATADSDNPTQSVDSWIDVLGEMPPPVDLPPELCYSNPNFSTPSISGNSFVFVPNCSLEILSNVCDTAPTSHPTGHDAITSAIAGSRAAST